jgi:hypothetical protein
MAERSTQPIFHEYTFFYTSLCPVHDLDNGFYDLDKGKKSCKCDYVHMLSQKEWKYIQLINVLPQPRLK